MRLILCAAVAVYAFPAAGQQFVTKDRQPHPRGGEGTFQQRWMNRAASDPGAGVTSFYSDRKGATGELLRPWDKNPVEHTCSRPDPGELGACLRVTGPGGTILCRVNDIGPAKRLRRDLDLLPAGFKAIGLKPVDGLGKVLIERSNDCAPPAVRVGTGTVR